MEENKRKHLLVMRFSALGDIAMTIPMVYSLAKAYPQTEITVLTSSAGAKLFIYPPENVQVKIADLKLKHKGFFGLIRLFFSLRKEKYNLVADLHNVLRTRFLTLLFQLSFVKTATLNKGRREKYLLTRTGYHGKNLKSAFARQEDTFKKLGFTFQPEFKSLFDENHLPLSLKSEGIPDKRGQWIGIAPFAKHPGKIYSTKKMEQVIARFASQPNTLIFLFGGGKNEERILQNWVKKYKRAVCVAGKFSFEKELSLISQLDCMISMDSANMHLASLVSVPVISIWGATHPAAGFLGWGQSQENIIQWNMPCRPCSIFGQKSCKYKNHNCMKLIDPQRIIEKTEQVLAQKAVNAEINKQNEQ